MEARNIPVDHDLVRSLLNRLEKGCYEKLLAEHKGRNLKPSLSASSGPPYYRERIARARLSVFRSTNRAVDMLLKNDAMSTRVSTALTSPGR